jgi:predicted DNA-binding transcriptional regulator YafY
VRAQPFVARLSEGRRVGDGRLAVRLHVSNDWALRSWLLGFGASVRVIRPKALADALVDEFARAAEVYNNVPGTPREQN